MQRIVRIRFILLLLVKRRIPDLRAPSYLATPTTPVASPLPTPVLDAVAVIVPLTLEHALAQPNRHFTGMPFDLFDNIY